MHVQVQAFVHDIGTEPVIQSAYPDDRRLFVAGRFAHHPISMK